MKKFILFFLFAGINVGMLSAQVARKVLIEEFTNASCPPCAAQNPAFNALVDKNLDKVVPIKYQTNFPGTDPMNATNGSEVNAKWTYYSGYGINGVPVTILDGKLPDENYAGGIGWWVPAPNGYPGGPYGYNQAVIDYAHAINSPISIQLHHSLNVTLDSFTIHVVIKNETPQELATAKHFLKLGLVEKELHWPAAPGTNGEKDFSHVFRKAYPNVTGIALPAALAPGEEFAYDQTFYIDPKYVFQTKEIGFVGFVQNENDKTVLQAEISEPQPFPDGSVVYDAVIENLSKFNSICSPDGVIRLKAKITNTGNAAFDRFYISSQVDSRTKKYEEIVATLNPGESTEFEFEADTAKKFTGTLKVSIEYYNENVKKFQYNRLVTFPYTATNKYDLLSPQAKTNKLAETFESVTTGFLNKPANVIYQGPSGGRLFANADKGFFGVTYNLGAYGNSNKTTMVNFLEWEPSVTDPSQNIMSFIYDKINLKDSKNSVLTFDRAYSGNTLTAADVLQVEVSKDCGATWTKVYENTGSTLQTASPSDNYFAPTADQWATDSVDISAFDGSEEVIMKFNFITGFGNIIHLDNINTGVRLVSTKEAELSAKVTLYPNPASDVAKLNIDATSSLKANIGVYDVLGKLVYSVANNYQLSQGFNQVELQLSNLSSGRYIVRINSDSGSKNLPLTVIK